MKPIGPATGSDHRGRERVLRHSARTARNRLMRTRMSGGVGAGRAILPATRLRLAPLKGISEIDNLIPPWLCHLECCRKDGERLNTAEEIPFGLPGHGEPLLYVNQ